MRVPSFLCLIPFSVLLSCSPAPGFRADEAFVVAIPRPPAAWKGIPALELELDWTDADHVRRRLSVEPGRSYLLEGPRGGEGSILLEASSRGRPLRPGGALGPSGPWGRGRALELRWEGGWVAELARRLEEGGRDPRLYDLDRLAAEAEARLEDPWLFGTAWTARLLESRAFRVDLLREPPRVPVGLPGPGPWWPESPLASRPAAPALEGGTWLAALPAGEHRFLGPSRELLVSLPEGGGEPVFVRNSLP